jgi:uncharacterized phiE125 gp8 family phage protein
MIDGSITQSSAPAVEPITLAEAKEHLDVTHSESDDYITALISTARQAAEKFQGRAYITQTLQYRLDGFPESREILLPRPPLQSVSSVVYVDSNGSSQTWDASGYQVDSNGYVGRIAPIPTDIWPTTESGRMNAVTVTYIAGYGDTASDVPDPIKHAIKLMIADWFDERNSTIVGTVVAKMPASAQNLLWQDRVNFV